MPPLRQALAKAENGFGPVAGGFLDIAADCPRCRRRRPRSGLNGLKRIELRWGFQDDALMTVLGSWRRRPAGAAGPARSADLRDQQLAFPARGFDRFHGAVGRLFQDV